MTTRSAERAGPGCASRQIRLAGRSVRPKSRPLPGFGLLPHLSSGSQAGGKPSNPLQSWRARPGLEVCLCFLLFAGNLRRTIQCGVRALPLPRCPAGSPAPPGSNRSVARNCAPRLLSAHRTDLVEFRFRAGQDGSEEQTFIGTEREMSLCLCLHHRKHQKFCRDPLE